MSARTTTSERRAINSGDSHHQRCRGRIVASRRGTVAASAAPWAPRARWALEGRRRAGRRRGTRRNRLRGNFKALHLGGGASCSVAWRPWTSEDAASRGSGEDARAWANLLAWDRPPMQHRSSSATRVGGGRVGRDSVGLVAEAPGRAPRSEGRRHRAGAIGGGGHARAAAALVATIILAAMRVGDAAGTELRADGACSTGPIEVSARWKQSLSYPSPHRDGFRDFVTADHVGAGAEPGRRNPSEEFALAVETVNSTGWGPMQRRLSGTTAHVVLGQETWVLPGHLARVSDWCRRHGWESILAPAAVGPGGGASGGVAIFARVGLGLR
jgi:hypothetical protein